MHYHPGVLRKTNTTKKARELKERQTEIAMRIEQIPAIVNAA
jgi:hypothetical protein